MRLIDADELVYLSFDGGIKYVPYWFIKIAPTVDAEPIVRCKDCRDSDNCPVRQYLTDKNDGFCIDGKRKTAIEE